MDTKATSFHYRVALDLIKISNGNQKFKGARQIGKKDPKAQQEGVWCWPSLGMSDRDCPGPECETKKHFTNEDKL